MRWTVTAEPPLTRDTARLLATVLEWFGLPDANQHYVGFLPLEETDLWGEQNPCLFMVKPLCLTSSGLW